MIIKIKNLEKAAKRILKAIKQKERIIIYGDSDLDGVSSTIITKEAISTAGGGASIIYFPDREDEGYGVNKTALLNLKKHAPALFVTLDCGIGNFKEVEMAKKMGFEVIIIDHHEILDKVPKASIVVDPKQKGDKYPFKEFANVGLAFKLAEEILGKKMSESLRKSFLELAAMGTIADMMPKTDDNETIIIEGIGGIEKSWRPGIQALLTLDAFKDLELMERVIKANSLLNIRFVENGYPAAFRLLTTSNEKEAQNLAANLFEMGIEKRKRIEQIVEEVRAKILNPNSTIIFDGSSKWELILLGIVAAIVSKNTKIPVFLYKKGEEESQGSVRAPGGFNTVSAMKSCSKFLETFGGHALASGFRVKNKNLEKFKACLIEYFDK